MKRLTILLLVLITCLAIFGNPKTNANKNDGEIIKSLFRNGRFATL